MPLHTQTNLKNTLRSALMVQNIGSYLENKKVRDTTIYTITKGGEFYRMDGKLIPVHEFNKMYPLSLSSCRKENLDGTRNWM